jgi:phospholipase D1/2
MNWQYQTINRGPTSLLQQLLKEFPHVDPYDYISFYSLRSHGQLMGKPITEHIYVHSKLMIVDDRGNIAIR